MATITYEASYPLNPREVRSGSLTVDGPIDRAGALYEVYRSNYASISGYPTQVHAIGIDLPLGQRPTETTARADARAREQAANDMLNAAARREGITLTSAQLAAGRRALYSTGSRQAGEMAAVGAANARDVDAAVARIRGASPASGAGTGNS